MFTASSIGIRSMWLIRPNLTVQTFVLFWFSYMHNQFTSSECLVCPINYLLPKEILIHNASINIFLLNFIFGFRWFHLPEYLTYVEPQQFFSYVFNIFICWVCWISLKNLQWFLNYWDSKCMLAITFYSINNYIYPFQEFQNAIVDFWGRLNNFQNITVFLPQFTSCMLIHFKIWPNLHTTFSNAIIIKITINFSNLAKITLPIAVNYIINFQYSDYIFQLFFISVKWTRLKNDLLTFLTYHLKN